MGPGKFRGGPIGDGFPGARKDHAVFLCAGRVHTPSQRRNATMATKAERVYQEVNQLIDSGVEKRDAFKQLAERYQQPLDSIRGAFYGWKKRIEGGGSRPRKRETTTADAIAAAQATLQKALEAIDREV